ncbi:MAG: glycosyltransferase family 2 protein [Candidatus Bathyarchaeota archaeon]|nr:glycosyltransferase family 2 protein [Candidatus Bathyarchaeota archaeon]
MSTPLQTGHTTGTSLTSMVSYPTINVGVVIPTLNEEKNIQDVICRLKDLGFSNVLVIDGKSKDNTKNVAAKNGAKVVAQTGRGKGNAIRQVLNNNYLDVDALVLMDADGSMDPQEIPAFIDAINLGADVAKGSRFIKGGYTHDMTTFRWLGNKLMMFAVNTLWPQANYTDLCYGYAVFNKRAVQELAPVLESEHFEIEAEIFIKALTLGLSVKEVPSIEYERKNGTSNLHAFKDGFKIFKTIFKQFFSFH